MCVHGKEKDRGDREYETGRERGGIPALPRPMLLYVYVCLFGEVCVCPFKEVCVFAFKEMYVCVCVHVFPLSLSLPPTHTLCILSHSLIVYVCACVVMYVCWEIRKIGGIRVTKSILISLSLCAIVCMCVCVVMYVCWESRKIGGIRVTRAILISLSLCAIVCMCVCCVECVCMWVGGRMRGRG